ncbi:restriction endonuclease [Tahibacter aquaticus]|uniref:Restriction endonuclease n=1 Tax=Tahibacter aquaticus TaxID=520092 RepID=A0A4R6YPF7_9GAMM|nr:restriction endonuclease [Tahibacter aquaticus]TDR39640.1 restriction endonuclease [Tahibacter aquaticus]
MTDLTALTPSQFENLVLDLVQLLGLKNCVWRTPGRDVGRDIQGEYFRPDFSGFTRQEIWYVECKRYTESVSWPIVWEKIAYAETHCADVLLFVTSSTLSPQAVDEVNRWNETRKSPVIRFWGAPDLLNRMGLYPQLLVKYGLSANPVIDSAISILPLTKILTKYANTAGSYREFGKSRDRIDEAIHALSELISARLEEVENRGKIACERFFSARDGYQWVDGNDVLEAAKADRYVVRALLALMRCHSTSQTIQVGMDGDSIAMSGADLPASETFQGDLRAVAFWGSMTITSTTSKVSIEVADE